MKKVIIVLGISSLILLLACGFVSNKKEGIPEDQKINVSQSETAKKVDNKLSKGQEMANILSSTNWQGTKVYDKDGNDLTRENTNLISIAKYDSKTARYEFFDKTTKESRGDMGTFFITNDGKIRVLISETMKYQAIVQVTALNKQVFTYKRTGKDANGNDIEIFVDHIPYSETTISFTKPDKVLTNTTGKVLTDIHGNQILSKTLWQGTGVLDENKNDVSIYNSGFLGLAKYDYETNKYEFFSIETGKSRGDYGYYAVVHENKIRANVSQSLKYGAVLELTELNANKFTYKRMGKDKDGKEISVFVEHVPYRGNFKLEFSK